jgi:hypothetical protein
MKIGNTNISTWNAKQRTISIANHNKTKHNSEWISKAVLPYFSTLNIDMKEFTVTLWVYGATRAAIVANCSNIIAQLMAPVDLTLDGYAHKFHGILQSVKQTERSVDRFHILELTFAGYEFGADVTVSGYGTLTITNPGNIVSPAIVEITPTTGASSIELTGICRDSYTGADLPCTIPTLVSGNTVRLDAMTGLVTEQGLPKDAEVWALPSFKPGNTTVTCNNNNMGISVTVRPLYI